MTCGEEIYNVHKNIVCSRSEFFRNAERFRTQDVSIGSNVALDVQLISPQEGTRDTIDLPEDEPQLLQLLFDYIYEGEYDPRLPRNGARALPGGGPVVTALKKPKYHYRFPHTCVPGCPGSDYKVCHHHNCGPETCGEACHNFICELCCATIFMGGEPEQLLLHAKMYSAGDKYIVDGLKELAKEKFERSCNSHWDAEYFAPAAHYAFSSTVDSDRGLRDLVIKSIGNHINLLNKPEVEALLYEFNDLAVGLLKRNARVIGWTRPEPADA